MNIKFLQYSAILLFGWGVLFGYTPSAEAYERGTTWESDYLKSMVLVRPSYRQKVPGLNYKESNYDMSKVAGYAPALNNIFVIIQYYAQVKRNGADLNPSFCLFHCRTSTSGIVFVDDKISFESLSPRMSPGEVQWYATGYSLDSPYGVWRKDAAAPDTVDEDAWLRDQNVLTYQYSPTGDYMRFKNYAPLSVNPPTITYDHTGSTATLDCDASGQTCTVKSPGTIIGHVNYGATYGKFYGRYKITNESPTFYPGYNAGPNNYTKLAMRKGWGNCVINAVRQKCDFVDSKDYTVDIPGMTVNFSIKADPRPMALLAPTLTVNTESNPVDTDFTFTAQGTDPSAGLIQYGFDFHNSGTDEVVVPAVPTLPSGTPQDTTYRWPAPGTYTVKVRMRNDKGWGSPWSDPVSVVVSPSPTTTFTINGSAGPTLDLPSGTDRKIHWASTDATSCNATSGSGWYGDKDPSGGDETLPPVTEPITHTLTCTGPGGVSPVKSITVSSKCTPTVGVWTGCACETEMKSQTNITSDCSEDIIQKPCDANEKKACRNFTWIETSP